MNTRVRVFSLHKKTIKGILTSHFVWSSSFARSWTWWTSCFRATGEYRFWWFFSRRSPGLDRKEERAPSRRSGNGNRSFVASKETSNLKQSEDTPSSSSRHASTPLRAVQKADDDAIGGFAYSSCVERNARGARSVDKQRRHLWEILEERSRVVVVVVVVVASRRRGKRRRFYGKRKEDCVSPSQAEGKGDLGETFRRFHDVEFKSGFHEQTPVRSVLEELSG